MSISDDIVQKSVSATIAAIEVYNKPSFSYREESFAILMVNAWELLLKARMVRTAGETIEAIVDIEQLSGPGGAGTTVTRPKLNRSGNPMTLGLPRMMERLVQHPDSGFSRAAKSNIELLLEIRDNAVHLVNGNVALSQRVQEIGTAALQNYLLLAERWFQVDLTRYNFFMMPISFFHGFAISDAIGVVANSSQLERLLNYIASVGENSQSADSEDGQSVMLTVETRLVRSKDAGALPFRWTADPLAPALTVREEDALGAFPLDFTALRKALKERYVDFIENSRFYRLKRTLEADPKYCKPRFLDPRSPKRTSRKCFYSTEILKEFDKHYRRRTRS